jgi:hypothetical protein
MRPVRNADIFNTIMCRLFSNLGASNCWNPQGLSRPVMGLVLPVYEGDGDLTVRNAIVLKAVE